MSLSGGTGRTAWQRLRSLPDRTPLRVKMITAVLALMIIALAVISFASRAIFGGYLTHQAETQLTDYYQSVYGMASRGHLSGSLFVGNAVEQVSILNSHGQPISVLQNGVPLTTSVTPPPEVPTSQAWLNANAGQPV